MAKRENDSNRIKDLIPKMLEENKLQKGMDQIAVKETWFEVMGPGIAAYTEDVRLQKDILIVTLKSSTVRAELQYGREKILAMMNSTLKGVYLKDIKLT